MSVYSDDVLVTPATLEGERLMRDPDVMLSLMEQLFAHRSHRVEEAQEDHNEQGVQPPDDADSSGEEEDLGWIDDDWAAANAQLAAGAMSRRRPATP